MLELISRDYASVIFTMTIWLDYLVCTLKVETPLGGVTIACEVELIILGIIYKLPSFKFSLGERRSEQSWVAIHDFHSERFSLPLFTFEMKENYGQLLLPLINERAASSHKSPYTSILKTSNVSDGGSSQMQIIRTAKWFQTNFSLYGSARHTLASTLSRCNQKWICCK